MLRKYHLLEQTVKRTEGRTRTRTCSPTSNETTLSELQATVKQSLKVTTKMWVSGHFFQSGSLDQAGDRRGYTPRRRYRAQGKEAGALAAILAYPETSGDSGQTTARRSNPAAGTRSSPSTIREPCRGRRPAVSTNGSSCWCPLSSRTPSPCHGCVTWPLSTLVRCRAS